MAPSHGATHCQSMPGYRPASAAPRRAVCVSTSFTSVLRKVDDVPRHVKNPARLEQAAVQHVMIDQMSTIRT